MPPSEGEVQFWLRQFGLETRQRRNRPPTGPIDSPFPPGYGEDVGDEE